MSSTDIVIKMPDTAELEKSGSNIEAEALAFQITDNETLLMAGERFNGAAKALKLIEAEIGPTIKSAHETHKKLTTFRAKLEYPWNAAKLIYGQKISQWNRAIEEKRQKEMAAAREKAEKEAEDKRIAEAEKAIDKGDDVKAKALLYDAPPPITVPIKAETPPAPKIAGYTERRAWDYEVEDVGALPMEYLMPNDVAIGKVVRALGDKTSIPGIRVFEKTISGSRGS